MVKNYINKSMYSIQGIKAVDLYAWIKNDFKRVVIIIPL